MERVLILHIVNAVVLSIIVHECDNDEYIITTDELLYKMVNYKEDDEHFVNISYCEC